MVLIGRARDRAAVGAALATVDRADELHRAALERFVEANLRLGHGRVSRVDAAAWSEGRRAGDAMEGLPRHARPEAGPPALSRGRRTR